MMKADASKRKIFHDAVDLLTDGGPAALFTGNEVRMLDVEDICPFPGHPFRLYEGERLAEMVDSVREHGILNPVIVQKKGTGYEMLSGHNRQNAAKIAGIREIPAIVKEGLTEQEAYVYVIETNMLQRSFSELAVSEKAAVLAERYDKVLSQGRRNDIIKEIEGLNVSRGTCGPGVHKSRSRDGLGEEYGLCGRTVSRLMRVNELIPEIRDRLDSGDFNFKAAVQLSYVPEDIQRAVLENGGHINEEMAARLRGEGVSADSVREIMQGGVKKKKQNTGQIVKIPHEVYDRYFSGTDASKVIEVIEAALEAWFGGTVAG